MLGGAVTLKPEEIVDGLGSVAPNKERVG